MENYVETIIIGALFGNDNEEELLLTSFKSLINLMLRGEDIFTMVPDEIYVPIEKFEEVERLASSNVGLAKDAVNNIEIKNSHVIKYFEKEGALLFDGLHASAFGKMQYIYRSKGIRIYVFRNAEIKVVCPYCTIDHNGFQLKQEEIASFDIHSIKNKKDVVEILNYIRTDFKKPFNSSSEIQNLIRLISNIKKEFRRDYFLEYLLTPPDVDIISSFSRNACFKMWEVCLSTSFTNIWGIELQNQTINLLSTLNIPPSPGQLIKYIKSNSKISDTTIILERIEQLENNINDNIFNITRKKEPIFEFKPNFNGIGINGNEALKRLKKVWQKK